jgi:2-C-methyl-D-erythritol 4-phosphate cytidylyltransferase
MSERFFALLPAAGVGARMQLSLPKQYAMLNGKPMIWHTIQVFLRQPMIALVNVVLSSDDRFFVSLMPDLVDHPRIKLHYVGGETRHESVLNGLHVLETQGFGLDWVLVHDAARPGLPDGVLMQLIDQLKEDRLGGILALPVADTLKRAFNGSVKATLSRADLWQAQTPQMFRVGMLKDALSSALNNLQSVTDEASALELLGYTPKLVHGSALNFKVTYPEDIVLMSQVLSVDRV